jgi:hypothetical protein
MKKLHLFLFAFLAFAATSCKKDKDKNDSVHLTCKIDGVEKSFNVGATAGAQTQNETSMFAAFGASAASETAEHLLFYITKSGAAVGAGTYTVNGEGYEISGIYFSGGSNSMSFIGGSSVETSEVSKALKIVITEISGTTVRGTFSGELYEDGDDSNDKKTISEGSFYLNITDQLPG